MKAIILSFLVVFVTSAIVFSCSKGKQQTSKKLTYAELKSTSGIDVIAAERAHNDLVSINGRGKPVKVHSPSDNVNVFNSLTFDGTTVGNMPFDWKFAGVQNLTLTISICNWYGGGVSGVTEKTCDDATLVTDEKSGWCTNMADDVFISN